MGCGRCRVRLCPSRGVAARRRGCEGARGPDRFAIVDVRDLAELHVRAMTSTEAAGQRFLAAGEFMWMEEIARTLKEELGPRADRVPTRRLPDVVFRLAAAFASDLRSLSPLLGKVTSAKAEKARRLLQFVPQPASTTIVDTAASLIE